MLSLAYVLPAGLLLLILSALAVFRWGYISFAGIVPVFAAIAYAAAPHHEIFAYLTSAIIIGSCTGLLFRGKHSVQFYVITVTLLCTLFSQADFLYVNKVLKIDTVTQSRNQWIGIIDASDASDTDKAVYRESLNDDAVRFLKAIMPFNFFMNALVWSTFSYLLIRLFFKRRIFTKGIKIEGIEHYKLSDYLIFALIASLAVFFAAGQKNRIVYAVSLNALLMLTVLYIVQALGIAKHFLLKKRLPTSILPVSVFLVLLLGKEAIVFTSMLLAGFGALDLWADFRKPRPGNDQSDRDI